MWIVLRWDKFAFETIPMIQFWAWAVSNAGATSSTVPFHSFAFKFYYRKTLHNIDWSCYIYWSVCPNLTETRSTSANNTSASMEGQRLRQAHFWFLSIKEYRSAPREIVVSVSSLLWFISGPGFLDVPHLHFGLQQRLSSLGEPAPESGFSN